MFSGLCAPHIFGDKNGPSKCTPRMCTLSVALCAARMPSMAVFSCAIGAASVVGKMDVVPYFACASHMFTTASFPPIAEYPPPPCTCKSINPGERYCPLPSITSAVAGASILSAISVILPFSTATSARKISVSPIICTFLKISIPQNTFLL